MIARVFIVLIVAVMAVGCLTKQQAADAGQIAADIACAIEQAELNDAEIAAVCKLTDEVFDHIRPALATHRRTLVKRGLARANTCDGGASP